MACCCKDPKSNKSSASCLGRCSLPRHKCLSREDVKPGPIPKHLGWLYTAKDSPEHQLRCGWRPGHIACPVLKQMEEHGAMKSAAKCCPPRCGSCCPPSPCCGKPCRPPKCPQCPPPPCCSPPEGPLIRIIRHSGNYEICTEPADMDTSPTGPYPLKYVLNVQDSSDDLAQKDSGKVKYSIEARYNDYQFDYTSSQASFVLDFTPPECRASNPSKAGVAVRECCGG